jgi:DNA-binding transcriptional LysR family regulator
MRFDLIDLRLFTNVVEAGSITRGAEHSNMALASASERIRGMELAFGLPLLTRARRGVVATPAGEALTHHARIVLHEIEQLRGTLGEYSRGLKAHIRLMANTSAMTEFLPDALAPYLAANPNIDIQLDEKLSHEIVQAVAGGLADVGIVADTVDPGHLKTFPFRTDRLVLVCQRDHLLSQQRRIALLDVIDQDFVGLTPGSPLQDYVGQQAARAGHTLRFRIRLRGFEGVCRMAEHGVGLGVVPETAARRCSRSMAIHAIPLTDPWALRKLMLCVRSVEALSIQARGLIQHLAQPKSMEVPLR